MYYLALGNPEKLAARLGERYQQVRSGVLPVVRDLSPHQPPPNTDESPASHLPASAQPYQRLNDWRWAVPEVFTFLNGPGEPCLLLSNVPVDDGVPWQNLIEGWREANVLQQLGWLAQIVRLWEPCVAQKVASSLLLPTNIGVQGWQIRLFYLKSDTDGQSVTLSDLVGCWRTLQPLSSVLASLIVAVESGQVGNASDLLEAIESLAILVASGRIAEVTAATDVGRRRKNNEDCFAYEPGGRFAIVCDGMGGHDGGEVASRMATESLEKDLKNLASQGLTPREIRSQLIETLQKANLQIWEVNQQQRRTGTGKMGTTVVACYQDGALLHVAHVGDSRIYLINRKHCQQLTVDHDLTQKEISRAHAASSAAALIPTGGTLTQALGLMPQGTLQPVVQSFVLPEECLVLLCSDGLCDGDLIERHWKSILRPFLDQDLSSAAPKLIELALRELGHDNITFVLLKYVPGAVKEPELPTVELPERPQTIVPKSSEPAEPIPAVAAAAPPEMPVAAPAPKPLSVERPRPKPWLPIAAGSMAAVLAGAVFVLPRLSRTTAPAPGVISAARPTAPATETRSAPPIAAAVKTPVQPPAPKPAPVAKQAPPTSIKPKSEPAPTGSSKPPLPQVAAQAAPLPEPTLKLDEGVTAKAARKAATIVDREIATIDQATVSPDPPKATDGSTTRSSRRKQRRTGEQPENPLQERTVPATGLAGTTAAPVETVPAPPARPTVAAPVPAATPPPPTSSSTP
ncbi:protein phosphatase 2C domain-containing protein [Gloeobacter kilaueensis]|uniref:Protein serine/threonine phosphatase n=1 Tax=Gloeobacter kilaueensis (strain ATCC BAA-2537 / CCAP 1431/1 / ULC 316 / JS1) TaxID=1183438 RepID=U5QNP8_GLOK1|nr:protein phosphatase 2C domain-containing protein [Gloeobacter kilaueensis]AGY60551.1 protein serine/threonine phosphatase [Gloeobacter kilaueensis JS1]